MSDLETPTLPKPLDAPEELFREKRRRRRRTKRRWYRKLTRWLGHYNWRVLLLMAITIPVLVGLVLGVRARSARRQAPSGYKVPSRPGRKCCLVASRPACAMARR